MQDNPGTVESYLMQVALEIRKTRAKYPQQLKMEHFRLRFTQPTHATESAEKQTERIVAAKKARFIRMGGKFDDHRS